MNFLALKPTSNPYPSSILNFLSNPGQIKPARRSFHGKAPTFRPAQLKFKPTNPDSNRLFITRIATNGILNVGDKVRLLASEFKSLPEPIDRVKRLLEYATFLPPFEESGRVMENRVMGCTTQVWLEARMDNEGSMRFRVDSDSEITKGFSSCLVWLLDGAAPHEVLSLGADELVEVNVGFPSGVRSRVNTWHNVLIGMQNKTRDCVEERESEGQISVLR